MRRDDIPFRTTLNGATARTVQDTTRDAFDFIEGPSGETGQRAIERLLMNSARTHRLVEPIVWLVFVVALLSVLL